MPFDTRPPRNNFYILLRSENETRLNLSLIFAQHYRGSFKSLNTGIITLMNYGKKNISMKMILKNDNFEDYYFYHKNYDDDDFNYRQTRSPCSVTCDDGS